MYRTGYIKGSVRMTKTKDFETAEMLSRRRARMLPVLAVLFLAQQGTYFSHHDESNMRTVGHLQVSAWIVLSIVLLAALVTGGSWFRPRAVRAFLNDEVTRAHRAKALETGFIATMTAAIALYFFSLFAPHGGRAAIHSLLSVGIACAVIRFGQLERRAHSE
jgi:hypothetical protein